MDEDLNDQEQPTLAHCQAPIQIAVNFNSAVFRENNFGFQPSDKPSNTILSSECDYSTYLMS